MANQYAAQNSDFDLDAFLTHQEESKDLPLKFPLHASSVGKRDVWKVLTRRLSMINRAEVAFLPDHLQAFVWEQLKVSQKEIEKARKKNFEPRTMNEALANNENLLKVADLFVMAAFVDPQIVLNKEDEDINQRKLHIDRIQPEDRMAFWIACRDAESEQARLFETFRPEPANDAPRGNDREVLGRQALRSVGDAGIKPVDAHEVQF